MPSLFQRRAPAQNPAMVLTIILGCYLMVVLDASVVITALPDIRADLGFSPASLSWVQNIYALTFGGLLLLAARALQGVGAASGLVNVFQQLGSTLGIGLLVTVFAASSEGSGVKALTEGVPSTIAVSAALIAAALAVVVGVMRPRLAPSRSPIHPAAAPAGE